MIRVIFLCIIFCVVRDSFSKSYKILSQYPSQTEPFLVEVLAENLGVIWGMVFISNHELLFTERKGAIKKLNIRSGNITPITGVPAVYHQGQGGLLDIEIHPQFQKNQQIYLSYSKTKDGKQTTAVALGIFKNNQITFLRDIFVAVPFVDTSRHFGSRLAFDSTGLLYVTIGDRVNRKKAQKLDNHFGKTLRLNDQGKYVKDNPFVGVSDALPEIWSFGHRNAQGLFFHPQNQELWLHEHGPRGGDEINRIQKGKNYGWPVITYGREYWGPKIGKGTSRKGMEQPVKYYIPSIAPSGLMIYAGEKFKTWKYHLFSGALVLRHLNKVRVVGDQVSQEERLLSDLSFRIREVVEGPQGLIYLGVDQGKILRFKTYTQMTDSSVLEVRYVL